MDGLSSFLDEGRAQKPTRFHIPARLREKTNDGKALWAAFAACKNQELGIQEAALLYGVHKRKLRSRLKYYGISCIDMEYMVFVLTVFPYEAEIEIAECLQDLLTSHVYMNNIDVRRLGYELVREKYNVTCMPQYKHCVLGQRWYKTLMEKYPGLDMEEPDMKTSMQNPANFYDSLETFVNSFEINSTTIFYVDGLDLKLRTPVVFPSEFGSYRKWFSFNSKAIVCTSPEGMFIPPIFIQLPVSCKSGECHIYDFDFGNEYSEGDQDEEEEEKEKNESEDENGDDVSIEMKDNTKEDPDFKVPVNILRVNNIIGTRGAKRNAELASKTVEGCNKKVKRDTDLVSETDNFCIACEKGGITAELETDSVSETGEGCTNKVKQKTDSVSEKMLEKLQEQSKDGESKESEENIEELKKEEDRERMKQELFADLNYNYKIGENPMTHYLFYAWFEKFLAHVRRVIDGKILLLLCDPNYIKYFKTLELAREYGVMFLVVPPHSIHRIHPLDGIAMSLARNMNLEAKFWLGNHPVFEKEDVPIIDFFQNAYNKTVCTSIAKYGFFYSGLWPINKNAFKASEVSAASEPVEIDAKSVTDDASSHLDPGVEM